MGTSKFIIVMTIISGIFATNTWAGSRELYGARICHQKYFMCLKVQPGESWESLWPDTRDREIMMRINRRNLKLYAGMTVAVPFSLAMSSPIGSNQPILPLDFSPFTPVDFRGKGNKLVVFDPRLLAWAAYEESGQMKRWGPASGGADWCDDIKRVCHTPTGEFKIREKYGPETRSNLFPVGCYGKTCAPIPYFMKFDRFGTGLHGSPYVPGWNDSHGCVRLFPEDAKWLNENFAEVGTTIIILPY